MFIYYVELGKFYALKEEVFEFVGLRIGWVVYDDPSCLHGDCLNDSLRAMWLSKRDLVGFFMDAITSPKINKLFIGYAVSNNSSRIYNIDETCLITDYTPKDSSDSYLEGS